MSWPPERRRAQAERMRGNKLVHRRRTFGWSPARHEAHARRMRDGQGQAMSRLRWLPELLDGSARGDRQALSAAMSAVGKSGWTPERRATQAARMLRIRLPRGPLVQREHVASFVQQHQDAATAARHDVATQVPGDVVDERPSRVAGPDPAALGSAGPSPVPAVVLDDVADTAATQPVRLGYDEPRLRGVDGHTTIDLGPRRGFSDEGGET